MGIELVGLAFNEKVADQVWGEIPIEDVYKMILDDDFRRRVDPRSLLYHKGLQEILIELEVFLKQGGFGRTMLEFMADRFNAGVEDFPGQSSELLFDYKLIRHFTSLAMVDDFVTVESSLRALLEKAQVLGKGAGWSLLETRNYEGISKALRDFRIRDLFEVREKLEKLGTKVNLEVLVRTYIEFLSYAQNNRLTPFFYNSQSDVRRWGNLMERKNRRGEAIVEISLRQKRRSSTKTPVQKTEKLSFEQKARKHRETEALIEGLRDRDPLIRQKSAESLGTMIDVEFLPKLEQLLHDAEPEVRQEIVRAISNLSDPHAEEILVDRAQSDEADSVRLIAAYLLTKQNSKRIISVLLEGISKNRPHFSTLLSLHPGLSKDKKAQTKLTEWATSEDSQIRREVAFLFGNISSSTSKNILKKLAQDEDEKTKVNALYSLSRLEDSSVGVLSKSLEKSASPFSQQAGTILQQWAKSR